MADTVKLWRLSKPNGALSSDYHRRVGQIFSWRNLVNFRLGAALAMAGLLAFGTAGCAFITPQATTKIVTSENGTNGDVGMINVRNATLISDDGQLASMLVTFYNSGVETQTLTVQYESKGTKINGSVTLPGRASTSFGAKGQPKLVLNDINSPAGSLLPIYFQYGATEGHQMLIPVLTSDWLMYDGLAPSPTPAPAVVPTLAPVVAPTPTASPAAR